MNAPNVCPNSCYCNLSDILADSLESPLRTSSRLSKTLLEVIRDKDALACFKSFLIGHKADHLIQFWCDAESFHASTLTRMRTHTLQSLSKSSLHKRRSNSFRQASNAPSGAGVVSSQETEAACGNRVTPHDLTQPNTQNSLDIVKSPDRRHFPESSNHEGYSKRLPGHDSQASPDFIPQNIDSLSSEPSPASVQRQTDGIQSVPGQTSSLFVHDHAHKPTEPIPPEPSSGDITKPNKEKRPVIKMLNVHCDSSPSTQPANPSELNLTDTNTQHRKHAALSQQPSDVEETSTMKSPTEPSQEDIAQRLKKSKPFPVVEWLFFIILLSS